MVWTKSAWAGGHRQRPDSVERPEGSFCIVTLAVSENGLYGGRAPEGKPSPAALVRPVGKAPLCQTWRSGAAPRGSCMTGRSVRVGEVPETVAGHLEGGAATRLARRSLRTAALPRLLSKSVRSAPLGTSQPSTLPAR